MKYKFDENIYARLNLAETIFSILKRKYGENLCKRYRIQVKKVKLKLLIRNHKRNVKIMCLTG
ncbi:hypothetical protein LI82_03295 [Methanococcoides methylutens]|uniref:Transposase n=1 Tax=Methanococcoides methylutens TaxID=2226 RepID=A0A099T1R0_METMT|nr:hypothetical protein LI82_03295 [Methanococcoides methylutens]